MAYSDSSHSCVVSVLKITICFEITASVYMQYVSNIYVIVLFKKWFQYLWIKTRLYKQKY